MKSIEKDIFFAVLQELADECRRIEHEDKREKAKSSLVSVPSHQQEDLSGSKNTSMTQEKSEHSIYQRIHL